MIKLRRTLWLIVLVICVVNFWVAGCTQKHESDVEYVPTPQQVVTEMLKMAGVTKDDVVYDLGCGDGRIVITAAKMFGARGVGMDIDPVYISLSIKNARTAGVSDRVNFIEGDLFEANLSTATVVALYLTPELNLRLRSKLFRELKPGARIVSHDFNMGDWKPDNMGRLSNIKYEYPDLTYVRDAPYYYWIIPANVAGTWRWSLSTSMGSRDYMLRLVQKFQEISGQVTMKGRENPIADARLAGDQLSFTVKDDADGEKNVMWFSGRIHGNAVNGNMEVQGGPFAGSYNWSARRKL